MRSDTDGPSDAHGARYDNVNTHRHRTGPSYLNNARVSSGSARRGRTCTSAMYHTAQRVREMPHGQLGLEDGVTGPHTWKTRSTARPPMNAAFRLENPDTQKPLGNPLELYPASAESVHSCPPLSHSHWILSLLHIKWVRRPRSFRLRLTCGDCVRYNLNHK